MKKRADGRYVKVIKNQKTGKTMYIYGASKAEVNRKILDYEYKLEKGRTFAEVAREWADSRFDSLAYQSLKVYKPALHRAIEEFGDQYIREITPKDISLFLGRLARIESLSKKTLLNQRTVINQVMEFARLYSEIMYNPCVSVPMPKATPGARRQAASPDDEDIVKHSSDIWIFPFIAIYTGMRKGEILALQWKDIDFANDIITVEKSVYHVGDKPYIKPPKTNGSIRMIPLLQPLKEKLLQMKRVPNNYVVSDDGKSPLTNRRYLTLYKKYKEATGAECTAHQLRHSFATIAIENGVPTKSVQEILGHQQISTTLDIYTDFRKKAIKEAKSTLEKAFN